MGCIQLWKTQDAHSEPVNMDTAERERARGREGERRRERRIIAFQISSVSKDSQIKMPFYSWENDACETKKFWQRDLTAESLYRKNHGLEYVTRVPTVSLYWRGRHASYVIAVDGGWGRWVNSALGFLIFFFFFYFSIALLFVTINYWCSAHLLMGAWIHLCDLCI